MRQAFRCHSTSTPGLREEVRSGFRPHHFYDGIFNFRTTIYKCTPLVPASKRQLDRDGISPVMFSYSTQCIICLSHFNAQLRFPLFVRDREALAKYGRSDVDKGVSI